MAGLRSTIATALAGAVSWTAVEYGLHRFAMHEMRGRGLASIEHLEHHADVTYFAPASKKLASAAGTSAVVFPLAWATVGRRRATAYTAGMMVTYYAYEVAHRRTHTHPPTNPYGRWARRSHMHHHFGAPMRNFGVTTPIWDVLLGTYDEPGVVTVPLRMAPDWLVDETGAVRDEYVADYVTKGGRRIDTEQADRDRVDAFANATPEI